MFSEGTLSLGRVWDKVVRGCLECLKEQPGLRALWTLPFVTSVWSSGDRGEAVGRGRSCGPPRRGAKPSRCKAADVALNAWPVPSRAWVSQLTGRGACRRRMEGPARFLFCQPSLRRTRPRSHCDAAAEVQNLWPPRTNGRRRRSVISFVKRERETPHNAQDHMQTIMGEPGHLAGSMPCSR